MQIPARLRRLAALFAMVLLPLALLQGVAHARSQEANLINVVSFGLSSVDEHPTGQRGNLLLANDGNIYMVSSTGGKGGGAIARVAPDGTLTVLHAFASGDEGVSSFASLIQASDGNLYGTTYLGGTEGTGVLFRISLTGDYAVLHSFGKGKQDAMRPYTGLVQASDGNFYGTTLHGGNNEKGTVFRATTTGEVTIIHHFDGANGDNPEGTLIVGADGNLYGTTLQGGADNRGTIYRISTSGSFTLLYSFGKLSEFNSVGLATNTTGANPRAALLLAADGNYYGTAYQGGSTGYGTVFRMTPAGVVSVVHVFAGPSFDGGFPLAAVTQDAAGNLYGTTERGGYLNLGSVWRVDTTGKFDVLHGFTGSIIDGGAPYASLLVAGSSLYGVTFNDQFTQAGSLFKLDLGSNGALPVEFSVSPAEISSGGTATLTWSSATAATCSASGAWNGSVGTSGTQAVTPASAGIYTYALSCTDGAGIARYAYTALAVKAPPKEPVDGGGSGGGGAMSTFMLVLLAALLSRKKLREIFSACP